MKITVGLSSSVWSTSLLEAHVRLVEVEAPASLAVNRVAAPAEVADRDLLVRVRGEERRLPVAVALLALDQRAAEPDDPVAVLELERVGPTAVRRLQAERKSSRQEGS